MLSFEFESLLIEIDDSRIQRVAMLLIGSYCIPDFESWASLSRDTPREDHPPLYFSYRINARMKITLLDLP